MLLWLACAGPGDAIDSDGDTDVVDSPVFPDGALVLPGVHLRDADGSRDGTVVLVGDRIDQILPADVEIPSDVAVLDTRGRWLTPGLVDPHVHLSLSGTPDFVGDTLAANLRAELYFGVTSVVDAGGPTWTWALRDRIAAGEILGPSVKALGPFVTTPGSHPCEVVNDSTRCTWGSAAGTEGRSRVTSGSDGIKIVIADADFTPWETPRLDPAAAKAEIAPVVAAGGLSYAHIDQADDAEDALDAGVGVLAHPPFDVSGSPLLADIADRAPIQSTLGAFAGTADLATLPYDAAVIPATVLDDWAFYRDNPAWLGDDWIDGSAAWTAAASANLVTLRDLGATIIPASDAGYWFVPFGWGLHRELRLLESLGFTREELLAGATAGAAEQAGWTDRGRIQPGMLADLLVLDGDPLVDLSALQSPKWVVLHGVPMTPAEIAAAPSRTAGAEAEGEFCLERADCGGDCDLLLHRCAADCPAAWTRTGACDADSFCAPVDGLLATPDGVCRTVDRCNPYASSCEPAWYAETCVPGDTDTFYCSPSGPRQEGQSCDYDAPSNRCGAGLFCSFLDGTCYRYCDPDAPDCPVGTCVMQQVDGEDWFGLCL